jgi:glycosyltransferase involved in cell wall biosynthesis
MKTAIVADWLVTYGGAEHVLAELRTFYPDAPFFTTVAKPSSLGPLKDADIRTTYLQRVHNLIKNHQVLLPFLPRAIESIDLTGYDLIISSSHAVGKGIIPPSSSFHVCYCHTPVRYAWEMEDEYLRDFRVPNRLKKTIKKQLSKLRRWDLTTAQRVDMFIANSTTTQERIKRIYGRESIVIPPPVEGKFFGATFIKDSGYKIQDTSVADVLNLESCIPPYYLAVGRMVPYKRFDLLIEVANKLKLPLKIAGRGQDEERLRALAGPTVEFLGFVKDEELPGLYANAKALLFPQYEDAGIVPLEAQATGTPVIAYGVGGALDSIVEHKTGVFFKEQTVESVTAAITEFETMTFDRKAIRAHAQKFTQEEFRKKFTAAVEENYEKFKAGEFIRH